jgi:hypothetical protein
MLRDDCEQAKNSFTNGSERMTRQKRAEHISSEVTGTGDSKNAKRNELVPM